MRKLTLVESRFIKKMIENCSEYESLLLQLNQANVEEMNDGGMGSLLFCSTNGQRSIGCEVAARDFIDEDGVFVSVTLNVDNYGKLYELDVWKSDFSKLISFPSE